MTWFWSCKHPTFPCILEKSKKFECKLDSDNNINFCYVWLKKSFSLFQRDDYSLWGRDVGMKWYDTCFKILLGKNIDKAWCKILRNVASEQWVNGGSLYNVLFIYLFFLHMIENFHSKKISALPLRVLWPWVEHLISLYSGFLNSKAGIIRVPPS